jgi:hypothetical protein
MGGARALHGLLEDGEELLDAGLASRAHARLATHQGLLAAHHLAHDLHRHGARDLPGGVAAHAVRHDEQAELAIDEKIVLVVSPLATDVGRREELQIVGERHERAISRRRSAEMA